MGLMAAVVATTLLILTSLTAADIINYEWADWSLRGSDDDLMRFVTVCSALPYLLESMKSLMASSSALI